MDGNAVNMQTWIWQQFSLQLPDDWEMLQFSKESSKGNCAFADRYMYRLEMNWSEYEDWPDFERMLRDYQAKLEDDQGMTGFRTETIGAWQGFHGKGPAGYSSRFGRYFEANHRLVELVFLWDDTVDNPVLKNILGSFRLELSKDGEQQWRAFGMDIHTRSEMLLSECLVQPARTRMVFTDNALRATRQDTFERLGMVDQWLSCNLDEWLVSRKPHYVGDMKITRRHHAHHEIFCGASPAPSMSFPRISRSKNWYSAAAWICPDDGRLYHVSRMQPAGEARQPLAGRHLACCDKLSKDAKVS